jgi:hypothetical protein
MHIGVDVIGALFPEPIRAAAHRLWLEEKKGIGGLQVGCKSSIPFY